MIEDLQTRWEKKRDGSDGFERFAMYRSAIQDGLDKLKKYYCKFDEKPAYILALGKLAWNLFVSMDSDETVTALHPYYKLDYIGMAWGGEKEQAKEREAGIRGAKNWKDIALRIFEETVRDP